MSYKLQYAPEETGAYRGLRLAQELSECLRQIPAAGLNLDPFWQGGGEHGRSETGSRE